MGRKERARRAWRGAPRRGRAHLAWDPRLGLGRSWHSGLWGAPCTPVFRSTSSMYPEERCGRTNTHTLPTRGSGLLMAPEPPALHPCPTPPRWPEVALPAAPVHCSDPIPAGDVGFRAPFLPGSIAPCWAPSCHPALATGCLGWKLGLYAVSVSLCWSLKGQSGQDAFHRAGGLPRQWRVTTAGRRKGPRGSGLRPGFGLRDHRHRLLGPGRLTPASDRGPEGWPPVGLPPGQQAPDSLLPLPAHEWNCQPWIYLNLLGSYFYFQPRRHGISE